MLWQRRKIWDTRRNETKRFLISAVAKKEDKNIFDFDIKNEEI